MIFLEMEYLYAKKYLNRLSGIGSKNCKLIHSSTALRVDSWRTETDNDCRKWDKYFN